MPLDLIRDSFVGQLIYYSSGRRILRHPEDKPTFSLPARYSTSQRDLDVPSETATLTDQRKQSRAITNERGESVPEEEILRSSQDVEKADTTKVKDPVHDTNLVTWYGPDDPDYPQNWSLLKRCFVTFDICVLTFSIYIGSSIYAPGIGDLSSEFGVSSTAATLGLTMFIVGYGVGPMFLAPLSEVPQLGRTTVYIVFLLIFVVIQVPTALCKNLGALLPLRFIAGFVGSPALATGAASLLDMWPPEDWPVVVGLWSVAGTCGPVLGPLIGGFAAEAKGWNWTIWILLWLAGCSLAFLSIFLPETSGQAILYRRAVRLRRITGNHNLRSQSELDSQHLSIPELAKTTLVRPFVLALREPIVACWNVYVALIYGILYIFIESFGVVFVENHGFDLGQNGLAFIGLLCGSLVAYLGLLPYGLLVLKPMFKENRFVPEARLPIAMVGAVLLPISMFWFGWTSAASIHWVVPIIGSSFFSCGTFLLFQAGISYLGDCYPRYAASIFAGNNFFRSMFGAAFPLFSTAFFHNLGVGQACSILGGISVVMLPIPFVLYKYGPTIRSWSRYAN